jgi:hypothetical protein
MAVREPQRSRGRGPRDKTGASRISLRFIRAAQALAQKKKDQN